jgi:hypothetical protein
MPGLWKNNKQEQETTAAAIARAVEERVVNDRTENVWLPYRLWTLEDRKGRDTNLTKKYLAAYYFIRHMKKDERPEDISISLSNMAKAAVAATSERSGKHEWYHITLEVYGNVPSH